MSGMMTLLDIAIRTGNDQVVGLIEETYKNVPELSGNSLILNNNVQIPNVGASRTIKGRTFKTLVRTALPTVGFRNANEGTAATKSTYENRTVETYIMNPKWRADKAVADSSEDGPEAEIALEAAAHTQAAQQTLSRQFYYGTNTTYSGDAKGHPGLLDSVNSAYVVDAAGTTANTGSSVWAVKFGLKDVIWVWGQNGQLDLSDVDMRDVNDSDGNPFTAYCQELFGYPGLQVGSNRCIGRIKKLTADSGKGLTDDLTAALLMKFPTGIVPDVFLMTKRSLGQLRDSRTATNSTGAPAPFPTESHGIPIAVTEGIVDTESLTL